MKILHLTYSENGGAGIAVARLNKALNQLDGITSKILVYEDFRNESFLNKISSSLRWRFFDKIEYKPLKGITGWSSLSGFRKSALINIIEAYDIVHLHWIDQLIDIRAIKEMSTYKHLVWTIHDKKPFLSCFHYENKENETQDDGIKSFIKKLYHFKQSIIAEIDNKQLIYVSPSKDYVYRLQTSQVTSSKKAFNIPNGVDTAIFKPAATEIVKKGKYILALAQSIEDYNKGFDVLINALKLCNNLNFKLLLLGKGNLSIDLPNEQLGYVSDDVKLVEVYSLADLFVIPSREDNLPNTVLESLACGTPVIGSNIGGIPDMVRPDITGDLFEVGNSEELAQKINAWFERDDLDQISKNCREIAVNEYDLSVQGKAYKKLYEEILSQ